MRGQRLGCCLTMQRGASHNEEVPGSKHWKLFLRHPGLVQIGLPHIIDFSFLKGHAKPAPISFASLTDSNILQKVTMFLRPHYDSSYPLQTQILSSYPVTPVLSPFVWWPAAWGGLICHSAFRFCCASLHSMLHIFAGKFISTITLKSPLEDQNSHWLPMGC